MDCRVTYGIMNTKNIVPSFRKEGPNIIHANMHANMNANMNMNMNTNLKKSLDINPPRSLQVQIHDGIRFIKINYDRISLYNLVKQLAPDIISHQGKYRYQMMMMARNLNIRFISGFCFWNDILNYDDKSKTLFNQRLLTKDLKCNPIFNRIVQQSDYLYVCSPFVNQVINKVYDMELPVINTISNITHKYKKYNANDRKYVTIINLAKLGKEKILHKILEKCNPEIPFYLLDSQGDNTELIPSLKTLLDSRNKSQNNKSILKTGHFDLSEIYDQTRILLVLSLVDETFCRVAYEGMAMGIPIISTNYGNLPNLLSGYGQILDDNYRHWIDAINSSYTDLTSLNQQSQRPKNLYPETKQDFINMTNRLLMSPSIHTLSSLRTRKNICILTLHLVILNDNSVLIFKLFATPPPINPPHPSNPITCPLNVHESILN